VRVFAAVALVSLAASVGRGEENGGVERAAGNSSNDAQGPLPVILLTGFEPFGPGRPPNLSWEGIESLDGQQWNGYQLVCKRLPVVWGKPMELLSDWISKYKPVAVFSFGQGWAFSLETRAFNQRGYAEDNNGQHPSQANIVVDGPRELAATIDAKQLVQLLSKKGYPIRVSHDAGHYLCEENLYTLEYLKATKKLNIDVSFCHIPSGRNGATAASINQFVTDVLNCWKEIHEREGTGSSRAAEQNEHGESAASM
jgi:pyroglutamyl-peptidase